MPSYNRIIMMGHLTRQPELKYLPSSTAVCEFGIASNHKYNDKEEVCFVDCNAFGKTAETIAEYLSKGDPIMVEGRLTLDTWQAQDGSKRGKHRITVDRFVFVGSRGGEQEQPAAPEPQGQTEGVDDIPF